MPRPAPKDLAAAADIAAGRRRASLQELFDLVHAVNPTQTRMGERERGDAYRLKAALQSLLIERFGDQLVVDAEDGADLVSIRHRTYRKDACHAVLRELSPAAQAWVRLQRDLAAAGEDGPATPNVPARAQRKTKAAPPAEVDSEDRAACLAAGDAALAAWDFDLARKHFLAALGHGPLADHDAIAVRAARALLSLDLDQLGDYAAALALLSQLGATNDPELRCLLGLAQAQSGDVAAAAKTIEGVEHERLGEVAATLARAALAAGDLGAAERWLVRVPPGAPCHDLVAEVGAQLTAQRARAAAPLEEQLRVALAAGEHARARELVNAITAVHPLSQAAAQAQAELRRAQDQEQAQQLTRAAQDALAAGDLTAARAALSCLEAAGHSHPDLRQRLAEATQTETARAEQTATLNLASSLRGELSPRVVEALWLAPEAVRTAACARADSPAAAWLLELGPARGQAACVAASVAAVALAQAERDLAQGRIAQAWASAQPHEDLARRCRRGKTLLDQLRAAYAQWMEQQATQGLQAAEACADADPFAAAAQLERVSRHALSPALHARRQSLEHRIAAQRHRIELQRDLAAAESAGDWLTARARAQQLLEVNPGAGDALRARSADFSARIAAQWIEQVVQGEAAARDHHDLHDGRKSDVQVAVSADGHEIVYVEACRERLFVRVLNLVAPARARAAILRTPVPLEMVEEHVAGDTLFLIGDGYLLAVDLHTFAVQSWQDVRTLSHRPDVDEVLFVPGGTTLWLGCRSEAGQRVLSVDRQRFKGTRDLGVVGEVTAVPGTQAPILTASLEGNDLTLFDEHGTRLWSDRGRWRFYVAVVDPAGRGLIALRMLPRAAREGSGAELQAVLLDPKTGWGAALDLGVTNPDLFRQAAASRTHGCVFVAVCTRDDGEVLIALAPSAEGLVELWRVPRGNVTLRVDDGGRHVFAVGTDNPTVHVLDRNPPRFAAKPDTATLLRDGHVDLCNWMAGAVAARMCAYVAVMPLLGDEFADKQLARTLAQPLDRDSLLALYACMQPAGREQEAWEQLARRYADDPTVTVLGAQRLVTQGRYADAIARLQPLRAAAVPDGLAQHVAHLLVVCHMHLGDDEQAIQALADTRRDFAVCCAQDDLAALRDVVEGLLAEDLAEEAPDRPTYDFVLRLRRADAASARGDVAGALAELDYSVVWRQVDGHALARLAACYLSIAADDAWFMFRKRRALAEFLCHRRLTDESEPLLGSLAWDAGRMADTVRAAAAWLNGADAAIPEPMRLPMPRMSLLHAGAFVFTLIGAATAGRITRVRAGDADCGRVLHQHARTLKAQAKAAAARYTYTRIMGLVVDHAHATAAHFRCASVHIAGVARDTPDVALAVTVEAVFAMLSSSPDVLDYFETFHAASVDLDALTLMLLQGDYVAFDRVSWRDC